MEMLFNIILVIIWGLFAISNINAVFWFQSNKTRVHTILRLGAIAAAVIYMCFLAILPVQFVSFWLVFFACLWGIIATSIEQKLFTGTLPKWLCRPTKETDNETSVIRTPDA